MEAIQLSYLDKFLTTAPAFRNERDEQLAKFHNKGIRVRKGKGYRDATKAEIALVLSHLPTGDLHAFAKQCENARSFPRYFWWALKPKTP